MFLNSVQIEKWCMDPIESFIFSSGINKKGVCDLINSEHPSYSSLIFSGIYLNEHVFNHQNIMRQVEMAIH